MAGSIKSLRQSLRSTGGYVNDHDYICKCRPVDVRHVLGEIERLQVELSTTSTTLFVCSVCDSWPTKRTDPCEQAAEIERLRCDHARLQFLSKQRWTRCVGYDRADGGHTTWSVFPEMNLRDEIDKAMELATAEAAGENDDT